MVLLPALETCVCPRCPLPVLSFTSQLLGAILGGEFCCLAVIRPSFFSSDETVVEGKAFCSKCALDGTRSNS